MNLGQRERSLQPKEFEGARYGAGGSSAHTIIRILAHKFFVQKSRVTIDLTVSRVIWHSSWIVVRFGSYHNNAKERLVPLPKNYAFYHAPVKFFLSSYRALTDGRAGIGQMEEKLNSASFYLSEWKITWIGTCSILRTSIDLFQVDAKSCMNNKIREELANEWRFISDQREENSIFWKFLREERNNIIHEYKWRAYEAWIKPDGTLRPRSLYSLRIPSEKDKAKPLLLMKDGYFKGRDSLELLRESADWVEERIYSAIRRAGFDPNKDTPVGDVLPTLIGNKVKSGEEP